MKGARLGDCAHPLVVELLGEDGDHSGAASGLANSRANQRIIGQAEDDLAQYGRITNKFDQFGVETAPIVGRLHGGDYWERAVTRALDEKGDAFEQTSLRLVFDARQKVGLDVDHHEDEVVWVDEEADRWMLAIS